MRGRVHQDFIKQINKEFICFIATVMQYSLKSWSSGEYQEQGRFRGSVPKGDHRPVVAKPGRKKPANRSYK